MEHVNSSLKCVVKNHCHEYVYVAHAAGANVSSMIELPTLF